MYNTNICSACGGQLTPGSAFCNKCGAPVAQSQPSGTTYNNQQPYGRPDMNQPTYNPQPDYGQPAYNPQPTYNPQPAPTASMPMKWHNALTTWLMILWAIANLGYAYLYFTGKIYFMGEDFTPSRFDLALEWLYDLVSGLEPITIFAGIYSLVYAGACFYTFPKLKAFNKDGLKFFTLMMKADIVINILLTVALTMVCSDANIDLDSSQYTSLVFSIAFASANITYYKKREHLFK